MGTKEKYDLIFSIGEACSCTQALRMNKLQNYSYPLDWCFGSDFTGRCKILASKFARFIDEKDLFNSYTESGINCYAYKNKYNDITFNHDFKCDLSFYDAYYGKNGVKAKYERRIARLLNKIKNSEKILIVYMESPIQNHIKVPNNIIIEGYNLIKNSFDNVEIDFVYIMNDSLSDNISKEILSPNISKYILNYKDTSSDFDYSVDFDKLKDIFTRYKLKLSLVQKLKQFFIKH